MNPEPLYKGSPLRAKKAPTTPVNLPAPPQLTKFGRQHYFADDGLRDAVNVALQLRQPLLLTGKPGTGKTMLAYSLAWELGLGEPLKFETKSSSESRDLFYTYDSLSRFHEAHVPHAQDADAIRFIQFNALGEALVRAMSSEEIKATFSVEQVSQVLPDSTDGDHKPSRSVVLIDEIDKAPRDFPNDILNEIEHMYFRIPELRIARVGASPGDDGEDLRPVVVITSNSEKALPDAFLRRCIFYHIPFPEPPRLEEIVKAQLHWLGDLDESFVQDAMRFFHQLHGAGLQKPPSTAELLNWLIALKRTRPADANPLAAPEKEIVWTLSCLAKFERDMTKATDLFRARNKASK